MNETLLQIPAEITKVTTMANRSIRIVADSQENLTDEQMAKVMGVHGRTGWWCFLAEERRIDPMDIAGLPVTQWEEEGKVSPSQRMRAIIFRLFEQAGSEGDFQDFYKSRMSKLCDLLKEKLN